jgi:hypothetical protein
MIISSPKPTIFQIDSDEIFIYFTAQKTKNKKQTNKQQNQKIIIIFLS